MSIRLRFLPMVRQLHQDRRTIQSGYGISRGRVWFFSQLRDIQAMFPPSHSLRMAGKSSLVLTIPRSEVGMPPVEVPFLGPSSDIERLSRPLHSLRMEN